MLNQLPAGLNLSIYHDEDVEIFLNGQSIAEYEGYVTRYVNHTLDKDAVNALQTGRNVIAVHCRQTGGGQFFDMQLSATGKKPKLNIFKLIKSKGEEIFPRPKITEYRNLKKEWNKLESAPPENLIQAMVIQEIEGSVPDMHVHIRGNANAKGEKVKPGTPTIFGGFQPAIRPPDNGRNTSGLRLALANWITRPDNPRSSRVIMNRLWQHHFGRGICVTSNDFGYLGERPSHPELLDWLATELVRQGWSLKQMHRLIMNSQTYRMSSSGQETALSKDPQNQLFWRFNMRRLSAEEIRDSVLATSGNLNLKLNGPSMYPKLDDVVLATSSTGAGKWGRSSPEEQARRSIYINIKRSLKPPELTSFDFADTDAPCPVRFSTTVPTQALNMINSRFINEQAEIFAQRLEKECGKNNTRQQIERGFSLSVSRTPTESEINHCLKLVSDLKREYQLDDHTALTRFCLLVLNLNEFIYLD